MAGVYSDNQPDFSFLAPGETKSFSQYWYPIREIGPPQAANVDAALSMRLQEDVVSIGVCVTKAIPRARILLWSPAGLCAEWREHLSVHQPWHMTHRLSDRGCFERLSVSVEMAGKVVIQYSPPELVRAGVQEAATEPGAPEEIDTNEELYLTGLHLDQYRHATRGPETYWQEALRRDPGDSRVNNALGRWHLRRGDFSSAEEYFRAAIARLTRLNPNPYDGEAYYNLGLALRFQERGREAYSAFYKATWNAAWRGPAYHALAEFTASQGEWPAALDHLERALLTDAEDLNARNLKVMVLRKLGRSAEAEAFLTATRELDRLDTWSRYLETGEPPIDGQQILDLSFDLARSGFPMDALHILCRADLTRKDGSVPVILYQKANLYARLGDPGRSAEAYRQAAEADPLYCFPSRLEEMLTLELALSANPSDSRAPYLLGNMLYDRRRHEEAIAQWEASAQLDPDFPTNWRNLGIAYFNIRGDASKASDAFDRAHAADPQDARILYERDQLWKRVGKSPEERLASLQSHAELVSMRHDLTVEMATLLNQTGEPASALQLLTGRIFQPWEGGEGLVLAQFMRSNLLLGQRALASKDPGKDPDEARRFFETILSPPQNLGEAKHLLANWSDVFFWIGAACAEEGRADEAARAWQKATRQHGDFQEMCVRSVSDKTFWAGLAYARLGQDHGARELFQKIYDYSLELEQQNPRIDYFATSLPAMLLFENDLGKQNQIEAKFLRAQALLGLEREQEARALLREVLQLDRNHPGAADLVEQLERGWSHLGGVRYR